MTTSTPTRRSNWTSYLLGMRKPGCRVGIQAHANYLSLDEWMLRADLAIESLRLCPRFSNDAGALQRARGIKNDIDILVCDHAVNVG